MVDDSLSTDFCEDANDAVNDGSAGDTVDTAVVDVLASCGKENFVDVSTLTEEERRNLSIVYYEIGGICPGSCVRAATPEGLRTVVDMMGDCSVDVSRVRAVAVVNNETNKKVRMALDSRAINAFEKAGIHRSAMK